MSACFSLPITPTSCCSSSPLHADRKLPPGTSCAPIDHLEFCSRAGEKGFPALSIAPTDPAAAGPPRLGGNTCSSRAFRLAFVQKWGFLLSWLLAVVCILLPVDNELGKFSSISQHLLCPRAGIFWEERVRRCDAFEEQILIFLAGPPRCPELPQSSWHKTLHQLRAHTARGQAVID